MTTQAPLTIKDIERYTGVSGLSEAKYYRLVFNIFNGLRIGATVLGAGAGSAAVGAVLGVAAIVAPAFAALAVFVSLGIPVAQAKQIVRERGFKNGFSIGCVIGFFGWGKPMVADFIDRTHGSGGAPSYMSGVYQDAYNTGLVLGYSSALKLDESDRKKYREALTQRMIAKAKSEGRKLYMKNWSDRAWIAYYANAFSSLMNSR